MKMLKNTYLTVVGAFGILVSSSMTYAFPIAVPGTEGFSVFVGSTSDIVATYEGNSASYSNDLYLSLDGFGNLGDDGDLTNDLFIFNNQSSAVGSTVNLGAFSVGAELIFRLHVNNTGNDFFTGAASRNPDANFHARVEEEWMPSTTLVSFEDLFDGPFDYNDLSFSFTNTVTTSPTPSIPIPGPLSLLGLGLVSLALRNRNSRKYK
jgi:hypothetical protein